MIIHDGMKASAAACASAMKAHRNLAVSLNVTSVDAGGRCGKNAGDAGELNTFRYSNREQGKSSGVTVFFFNHTNSVPNKPAVNKAIGRIIRKSLPDLHGV